MEKKEYNRAEITITEFETEDVITTSGITGDNDDLEFLPENY